jgi:hypothetical protein
MARRDHFGAAGAWAAIGGSVISAGAVAVVVGSAQATGKVDKQHPLDLWANHAFVGGVILAIIGGAVTIGAGAVAIRGWWLTRHDDGAKFALVMLPPELRFTWPNQTGPIAVRVVYVFSNSLPDLAIEYQTQSLGVDAKKTLYTKGSSLKTDISPAPDDWKPIGPSSQVQGPTCSAHNIDASGGEVVISCTVRYRICDSRLIYERDWRGKVLIAAHEHQWPNVISDWDEMANEQPHLVET